MKITSKLTTAFLTTTTVLVMSSTLASASTYKIKTGDTLGEIAQTHKTTVQSLSSINGLSNPDFIVAGHRLSLDGPTKTARSINDVNTAPNTTPNTPTHAQGNSSTNTPSTGWTTMEATAYDPQVAAGGQGTSIPTGSGVAANLSRYPKGTQLEIKYQDGHVEQRVCNDTGEFAYSNPNQLDISMTNAEALQFGRQQIQVRVVG